MPTSNVYLAIDAANIFLARDFDERINYEALLHFARNLGTVVESAIYVPRQPGSDKEKGLLIALKHLGYSRVIGRSLRGQPNGSKKSDIDVALTLDLWDSALRRKMDTVILVSGDSDFVPLIERLVSLRINVHVIGPARSTAWEVIVAATHFWQANDIDGLITKTVLEPAVFEQRAA